MPATVTLTFLKEKHPKCHCSITEEWEGAPLRVKPGNLPHLANNIVFSGSRKPVIKILILSKMKTSLFMTAIVMSVCMCFIHTLKGEYSCANYGHSLKKIFLTVLYIFVSCMFIQAQEGDFRAMDIQQEMKASDKLAILMVHFGTTHDDTRTLTIDAINKKAQETFPNIEVREAYTSRIVIRKLKERNIFKQTPEEVLLQLKQDGYTHILVQPTELLDGVEMSSIQKEINKTQSLFKEVRIGRPLLYSVKDFETVINALSKEFSSEGATVLIGHGTYRPITASYTMLDYMLKAKEFNNVYVGTVEGYPSFQDMLKLLHKDKQTKVKLIPFMFVAGEHAQNDMAIKWKQALEKEGFEVTTLIKGLGQNPDVQNLYINHLKFIKANKPLDIEQKKAEYAAGKEKQ